MKKTKNLKKRIRRIEARLQKGAKKLAKLKRKLEAAETVAATKTKRKPVALYEKAARTSDASARIHEKKQPLATQPQVKSAASVKEPSAAKKPKRKLNLTPERRAQLAAAMKARWAVKRAAAATSTQNTFPSPRFSPGDAPQPPP